MPAPEPREDRAEPGQPTPGQPTPGQPGPGKPVDRDGGAKLFEALSAELRHMAGRIARREAGHTLQPTALVNELFMKMFGGNLRSWNDEVHFMRSAAASMRCILLDHKKAKDTQKRGCGVATQPLDAIVHELEARCGGDLFGVHEAMDLLAIEDPVLAEYVSLRFFGGRTNAEASRILDIADRTGERHWQFARAWLQRRLAP